MRTPAARCLRRAACFAYVRGARAQTYALLADPTIHFLSPAMMFLVVTVWSRKTTEETVTWFGVLNFGAKWLPWAMLLVSLMLNNNPSESDPAHSICAVSSLSFLHCVARHGVLSVGWFICLARRRSHQLDGRGDGIPLLGAVRHLATRNTDRAASGRG